MTIGRPRPRPPAAPARA